MKRKLYIMIVLCLILGCLTACAKEEKSQNVIEAKNLTQEQEDIISLLTNKDQEILSFDFQTDESFRKMEFWVEIYENGELVNQPEQPAGITLNSEELGQQNGELAVMINHNDGISFSFITRIGGAKYTHNGDIVNFDSNGLGRGYGPITAPIILESGKEIVLYTSIYSDGNMASYSDQQIYIEQPELLNDYPYAFLIKCKFE